MALSLDKMLQQNSARQIPINKKATNARSVRPWEDLPKDLEKRLEKNFSKPSESSISAPSSFISDSGTNALDSGTKPGTNALDSGTKPGTNALDSGTKPGTNALDSGTKPGTNALDSGTKPGTNALDSGTKPGTKFDLRIKSDNSGTKPGTKLDDSGTKPGTKLDDSGTKPGTKLDDSGTKPGTKLDDSGTKPGTKLDDSGTKPGTKLDDSGTKPGTKLDDSGTKPGTKPGTKIGEGLVTKIPTKMPRGTASNLLLNFLFSEQNLEGPFRTRLLSRAEIAAGTGLSTNTVKIMLKKLVLAGYIVRANYVLSSVSGGTSFYAARFVQNELRLRNLTNKMPKKLVEIDPEKTGIDAANQADDSGTKPGTKSQNYLDVSSSSYKNNYKQTVEPKLLMSPLEPKRAQREMLEQLQVRLDLDSLKLGLNDLLPVAHDWDSSFDELAESLEHLVFYLRSPDASSIKSPKAWLLKQLRAGYYGAPANFVSWEDQQAEAKLHARQQQAERRQQRRIQMLQADFDLWLADLTTAERQAIFEGDGKLKPEFITPQMQLQMLRMHFAQLHGVPEFVSPDSQIEPEG